MRSSEGHYRWCFVVAFDTEYSTVNVTLRLYVLQDGTISDVFHLHIKGIND